jgi:hypothetical protein
VRPPPVRYSHKQRLPKYDVHELLTKLFAKAKETDEFEYCSTLLRLRGMEAAGWDPLKESLALMQQVALMYQAPLDLKLKLRLSLFLYCHATEMHDLYHIVGNMLRVCSGERYSLNCFTGVNHPSGNDASYPPAKAARIKEWADAQGMNELGEMFSDMVVKEVRNAFFHSDYTLHDSHFHIARGAGVVIENMIDQRVPMTWLAPRLELGINTALALVDLVIDSIQSYTEDKIVMGRILGAGNAPVEVELTVQEGFGLVGFASPPKGSS